MAQCTQTRPWYNVILCILCSRFYHKTVVVSNSFISCNVLAHLFLIKFETVLAQGKLLANAGQTFAQSCANQFLFSNFAHNLQVNILARLAKLPYF